MVVIKGMTVTDFLKKKTKKMSGKGMYVLFNHALTAGQIAEAKRDWGAEELFNSESADSVWRQIAPDSEIDADALGPVLSFLKRAKTGDLVFVQGEHGATFAVVDWCLRMGLVPVHSTSKRVSVEKILEDGTVEKTSRFEHVRFRKYRRCLT